MVLLAGAVMMVVGSGAYVLGQKWAPIIFAIGVAGFVAMQFLQAYEGDNPTIRRLRGIMTVSHLLFVFSALLMFANLDNLLGLPWPVYVRYVHNNWVVVLLVAAILQLYSSHRISNELDKEAKKT